jgi:hypothetical protein
MVVALTALVVACSGTAVAAGVLITSSSQIRPGVITGNNIHSRTITGKLVQRGSLGSDLLTNGSIGTGKLTSDAIRSLQSSGTTGLEWYRVAGPENVSGGNPQRVMTITNVPPGVYAIFSKTILTDLDPPAPSAFNSAKVADGHCQLSAGAQVDEGRSPIGTSFGNTPAEIINQETHTFGGPGDITLDCDSASKWRASDSTIIAIRLGNSPLTQVFG